MECPKCSASMETVTHESIEVDRCTGCQGIWFDMLEREQLKRIKGSETIDIGSPKTGKQYNEISHINCPKCQTAMIPMVDIEQPHIQFEGCSVCYGVFFDAGEFRDYKVHNILDFFRDLFIQERS